MVIVLKNLVKSRVMLDFKFLKIVNDLERVLYKWCFEEATCTVVEDILTLLQ